MHQIEQTTSTIFFEEIQMRLDETTNHEFLNQVLQQMGFNWLDLTVGTCQAVSLIMALQLISFLLNVG